MENRINIMFLYSSKGFGGMVRNVSLIAGNIDKTAFCPFVAYLADKNDNAAAPELPSGGPVRMDRFEDAGKFDRCAVGDLVRYIDENSIDVLSCHGYKADLYGLIAAGRAGKRPKTVMMAHGWNHAGNPKLFAYMLLDRLLAGFFDKVILVSASLKAFLPLFFVPGSKITVINNAVEAEGFVRKDDIAGLRAKFGLDQGEQAVGVIGRLSSEKGLFTIIGAIEALKRSYSRPFKFIIAGDGPLEESVKRFARKKGVEKQVVFAGFRRDVREMYGILDVYVSASVREAFPNALLEAQAAAVPCVVTDVPGNNEIVNGGINGLLVKPNDSERLAASVLRLLSDREFAAGLAHEGVNVVKGRFTLEKRMRLLEAVYKGILL
jgi:glycosyltransferase involved in cell wall biosynthesis